MSCSNCTDYQSRRLEVRYGTQGKTDDGKKLYCHMLNSTLVATERCLCCVIENYQTKCGIRVPDVLQVQRKSTHLKSTHLKSNPALFLKRRLETG